MHNFIRRPYVLCGTHGSFCYGHAALVASLNGRVHSHRNRNNSSFIVHNATCDRRLWGAPGSVFREKKILLSSARQNNDEKDRWRARGRAKAICCIANVVQFIFSKRMYTRKLMAFTGWIILLYSIQQWLLIFLGRSEKCKDILAITYSYHMHFYAVRTFFWNWTDVEWMRMCRTRSMVCILCDRQIHIVQIHGEKCRRSQERSFVECAFQTAVCVWV